MGDSFKIRLNLQGSLLDNTKIKPIIQCVVSEEMLIVGELIVGQLQKSTPVGVTANMRQGWFHEGVTPINNALTLQISNKAEYTEAIDQERKAAMPPVEPLINWVQKKLGIGHKMTTATKTNLAAMKARPKPARGAPATLEQYGDKRGASGKSGSGSSASKSPAAKIAWAIAIRMSRFNTPGKHFVQKALEIVFPKVNAYLKATLGESLSRGFEAGGSTREESR